jgi:hypothetical protein
MSLAVRTAMALDFFGELAEIVTSRGASLRLGFKGRFAYLQAQWPGAEEALSLLRAENFEVVRYLTEAEESQYPEEPSTQRGHLSAERAELAFTALEMRAEIDALVERTGCRPRLANDGKRAWLCVQAQGDWIPVLRCVKGNAPKRFNLSDAMKTARPDVDAIRRGERRMIRPKTVPA